MRESKIPFPTEMETGMPLMLIVAVLVCAAPWAPHHSPLKPCRSIP